MNLITIFPVLLALVACAKSDEKYTTKYDSIDIQEILGSKRLLNGYCKCLLDQGPCSPDGAELKRVLPDAIETECSKCSDKQRNSFRTVLKHLIDNEKQCWDQLEKRYDPSGEYKKKYKETAEKEGLKI